MRFDFELVSKWFEQSYTVLNADKYHFICPAKDTENGTFIFNNFMFDNSNGEIILGITTDDELTFKSRINSQKVIIFNSIKPV